MDELAIAMVMALLLVCFLLQVIASKQKYFPEHLAILGFGMFVGTAASFLGGEEDNRLRRIYFLEFSEKLFFMLLAPPLFLEAGYSLNRRMFFNHNSAIFALGVLGTYFSVMLFAACIYYVLNHVWACGLDVPISFQQCVRLGAIFSTTDATALLRIFSNVLPEHLRHKLTAGASQRTRTGTITSIVIGESLANNGIGLVMFWHTANSMYPRAVNLIVVPLVLASSCILGIMVALVCSMITKIMDMHSHPQLEFLISMGFALLSYFLFIEVPFVNELVTLYSCGFAMAHYNFKNISRVSKVTAKAMIKSSSWASFTFIYFQMGLVFSISFYGDRPYWRRALPLISLVLMVMLTCRALMVWATCALVGSCTKQHLGWREQVILNFSGIRGAVSYALCLVWRGRKLKSSLVTTTTLGVVIFSNVVLGSALRPAITTLYPDYKTDVSSVISMGKRNHRKSSDRNHGSEVSPVVRHSTPFVFPTDNSEEPNENGLSRGLHNVYQLPPAAIEATSIVRSRSLASSESR